MPIQHSCSKCGSTSIDSGTDGKTYDIDCNDCGNHTNISMKAYHNLKAKGGLFNPRKFGRLDKERPKRKPFNGMFQD